MSNKVKSTNLSSLNRSWAKTLFDNLLVGKLFDIKVAGSPIVTLTKDVYDYNTTLQGSQHLTESEIRFIDGFVYSRGHLFSTYQIIIPNLSHERTQIIEGFNEELGSFFQSIEKYKELDIFWYDRDERLSDYTYYFEQLDEARNHVTYFTEEGKAHSDWLRSRLENDISNMIVETEARSRECFLIVATPLYSLEDVETAKQTLNEKLQKLNKSLKMINIGYRSLDSLDLDWVYINFVSHKIMR